MAEISVITVTWNSAETIGTCIGSVLAESGQCEIEMIVVDNDSSDATCSVVGSFPEIRLLSSDGNVGFARACNAGMALSSGKYIALVNPDSRVTPGMFRELLTLFESNPKIVAVGPKILTSDGKVQRECGRRYIRAGQYLAYPFGLHHIFKGLSPYLISGAETSPLRVEGLSGACMLVRRDWIEEYGGLDEQMFMYVEDVDWCYRMGASGFEVWHHPGAVLEHVSGASARKASLPWARRVHYGGELALHRYLTKVYGSFAGTFAFLVAFPLAHVQRSVRALISGLRGDPTWRHKFLKYSAVGCWLKVAAKALNGDSYTW